MELLVCSLECQQLVGVKECNPESELCYRESMEYSFCASVYLFPKIRGQRARENKPNGANTLVMKEMPGNGAEQTH